MKTYFKIALIAVAVSMYSCGGGGHNTETNDQSRAHSDTSTIDHSDPNLNSRGLPEQSIPDNSTNNQDSLMVGAQGHENLPSSVRRTIESDQELRGKQILNSRTFDENGRTMYEITFEDGQNTKVTFDQDGRKTGGN